MAARAGMIPVIAQLRRLTEAGTADYTLAQATMWSDAHLQDELDMQKSIGIELRLTPLPQYVDGTTIYKLFQMPKDVGPFEQPEGGAAVFKITDSDGAAISTALFSVDLWGGLITFAADQAGSARFWTGYSFNLNKVASRVWASKAAHAWTAIDFSADGQRFTRSALHKHCLIMRDHFIDAQGIQSVEMFRSDMQGVQGTFK